MANLITRVDPLVPEVFRNRLRRDVLHLRLLVAISLFGKTDAEFAEVSRKK